MRTPPHPAARLTLASCLLASTAAASPAPLERSRWLLTIDRLFGLSRSQASTPAIGTSLQQSDRSTGLSLLSSNGANPYSLPLLGLHYSLLPSFTIGVALGFLHVSGDANLGGSTFSIHHGPRTTVVLAPRVGYLFSLSGMASIWLRGGVTYFTIREDNAGSASLVGNTVDVLALSVDSVFAFTPLDHLGFTLGPVVDRSVSGSVSGLSSPAQEVRLTNLAVQAGLLGAF